VFAVDATPGPGRKGRAAQAGASSSRNHGHADGRRAASGLAPIDFAVRRVLAGCSGVKARVRLLDAP
jgi:hypothetical protein